MKAEYVDERDNPHNPDTHSLTPNMFSKFHQPPPPPPQHQHQQTPLHHPHPQYHPHLHLPDPNPFHFSKDPQTSEEADSAAAAAAASTPPAKKLKTPTRSDDAGGETIEVVRRPRGRPPGSKNKPKPTMVITRKADAPSMSPYILEIPSGADVVESLVRLTRRRGFGLCVLSGSGAVANVTLRQHPTGVVSGGGTVTFHGRFDLASISAVLLPGGNILGGSQQPLPFGGQNGNNTVNGGAFTITLSAPQGHIVGGKVVGPLMAAGTVYVVAASFNNPTFHKLPSGNEEDSGLGGGGEEGCGGGKQQMSSPAVSGGGGSGGEGSGGGVMYSCHVGGPQPDVIWTPTARPPHQHPHPY